MSENLDRIRTLTNDLNFPPVHLDRNHPVAGHKEGVAYETEKGLLLGYTLYHTPLVSSALFTGEKGVEFPTHQHDTREWIIIVKGLMLIRCSDGQEHRLGPGGYHLMEPHQEHNAVFLEDTELIAVTVPAAGGYPGELQDRLHEVSDD